MAKKSAEPITFFLKPGAARNVDALQTARAQGDIRCFDGVGC